MNPGFYSHWDHLFAYDDGEAKEDECFKSDEESLKHVCSYDAMLHIICSLKQLQVHNGYVP